MPEPQSEIISLPQAAKTHIGQLQANINLANQVFANYLQGCFDSLLGNQDGMEWEFDLAKMCFKKKVPEKKDG